MNTVLITDNNCDLPQWYVAQNQLMVLPFNFRIKDREYTATRDPENPDYLDSHDFYEMLRQGKVATTAQINVQTFLDAFRPILEQGKDILYLAFSSGLSGTCQSAMTAAQMLGEEFPERKIRVVDSLSASLGQGLLAYKAVEMQKAGATGDEIEAWLNENKLKVHHWFTVDDLNCLKRGGRVSATAAFLGTMLSIKPVLNMDDEGHLIPKEKTQGRKRALKALVDKMEANCSDPKSTPIFISHGDCADDCALVARMIEQRFGVKVDITNTITPVVGAHSGPGTLALFFIGDKPRG